jgi:hypothetical protein
MYPLVISKSVTLLEKRATFPISDLLYRLERAVADWGDEEYRDWGCDLVPIKLTYRHRVFVEAAKAGKLACASCGMKATHFVVEKMAGTKLWPEAWVLNLYGLPHSKDTYFTQDHIVPKSKGGPTDLNNLQVMCWPCNNEKGNS